MRGRQRQSGLLLLLTRWLVETKSYLNTTHKIIITTTTLYREWWWLANEDMILFNDNKNCPHSADEHDKSGNCQTIKMSGFLNTAAYSSKPLEVASSSTRLETFCKAVVDLAATTRKKVNAVNYTDTDCIGESFTCGLIADNSAQSTRPSITKKSKSLSRSKLQRAPHPEETVVSINHDVDIVRQSQRTNQTNAVAVKNKTFVKYSMSKTPHFLKNPDFLRCVATASRGDSLSGRVDFETAMKNSLVWIPQGRDAWFDCLDELAYLCSEASLRWALNAKSLTLLTAFMSPGKRQHQSLLSKVSNLVPPIPLAKAYIRERLDIDDPLHGYQIRHSHGGWLQGFITWTTFTTWTRYFQWNSLHPAAGMPSTTEDSMQEGCTYDVRGIIAKELEKVHRSGDPLKNGVIWPSIAEIALVGGLGCGEYLLQMALEDIASQGCYNYVVLQATETSWSFYEKFGFVRVGAVCTYGQSDDICGYRHWTYADEKNLDARHGGPSYMMVKKVEPQSCLKSGNSLCEVPVTGIWEALQSNIVRDKPTILPWTEQDDFILQHPNPNAPAIMDIMKKGNKWLKDFNSKTCDHLLVSESFLDAPVTVTSSSLSKKRIDTRRPATSNVLSTLPSSHAIATRSLSRENSQVVTIGCKRPRQDQTTLDVNAAKSGVEMKPRTRIRLRQNAQLEDANYSLRKPMCRMEKDRILKQRFNDKPNVKDVNPFFFNKVVALKRNNDLGLKGPYYFVVHYEKKVNILTLIELEPYGNFLGRLKHRTRWRAIGRDVKDKLSLLKVVDGSKYEIVPAEMITKSCCIHEEGWNLLTD